MPFDHEKLDVYQRALDFMAAAGAICDTLPRGSGYLWDQLQRAALSIVLNIAEGAGRFSGKDKAAFYQRARGSATECAAVLDVGCRLELLEDRICAEHKNNLERIVQMLTKLIKVHA
jgi:four helix bundle protein